MQLTAHFTLEEMTASQVASRYGIDNTPKAETVLALRRTCEGLERIRSLVNGPLHVSSGYRSSQLNKRVGGVPGSQHVRGEAADISAPGMTPEQLASLIQQNKERIGYDQLILEYPGRNGWVHVSFTDKPRGNELTKTEKGYQQGVLA